MSKYKLIAKPVRTGYSLVVDHEATRKYGRRMLKWVPINPNKEEQTNEQIRKA